MRRPESSRSVAPCSAAGWPPPPPALVWAPAAILGALAITVSRFPRGLLLLAFAVLALVLGWYGLVRRGVARVFGLATAALLLVAGALLVVFQGPVLAVLAVVAALVAGLAAAKAAFVVG